MKSILKFVKDFMKPTAIGTMVVNGNYFRPMANKKNGLSSPKMSEAKYYEICDIIRKAD